MRATLEPIQIRGIESDTALGRHAAKLLARALSRLPTGPAAGRAAFFDDNGPKGGRAIRCALTVRLPHRPSIRVERSAVSSRLAFDAAFPVLERRLRRYRERVRDSKRRPRKYFAARRALGQ